MSLADGGVLRVALLVRAAPPTAYEHSYTFEDVWGDPSVAADCTTFGVEQVRRRLTAPTI